MLRKENVTWFLLGNHHDRSDNLEQTLELRAQKVKQVHVLVLMKLFMISCVLDSRFCTQHSFTCEHEEMRWATGTLLLIASLRYDHIVTTNWSRWFNLLALTNSRSDFQNYSAYSVKDMKWYDHQHFVVHRRTVYNHYLGYSVQQETRLFRPRVKYSCSVDCALESSAKQNKNLGEVSLSADTIIWLVKEWGTSSRKHLQLTF